MYLISKQDLLTPLKTVVGVVEQRQTIPVLANTLVSVQGDKLTLTATDAEVEIKCEVPLNTLADKNNEGSTTIPARKLYDICKSLGNNTNILIDTEENQVILKAGKSKFKLKTLPADDFPNTPELKSPASFDISQCDLKRLFNKTSFSVATNDVRYYLTGLLLELKDNKIIVVGTDGHRMAIAQHEFASEQEAKVIIPRKAVLELSKLLLDDESKVTVLFDDNHIRFELSNGINLTSKLIDGEYPNWESVLPANANTQFTIGTIEIKEALSRVLILSNEYFKSITLNIRSRQLDINAKNSFQEEANEVLQIEYDGEELEVGFNGLYILDVLAKISSKNVKFSFENKNSSCLITENDKDFRFIVMPIRL